MMTRLRPGDGIQESSPHVRTYLFRPHGAQLILHETVIKDQEDEEKERILPMFLG